MCHSERTRMIDYFCAIPCSSSVMKGLEENSAFASLLTTFSAPPPFLLPPRPPPLPAWAQTVMVIERRARSVVLASKCAECPPCQPMLLAPHPSHANLQATLSSTRAKSRPTVYGLQELASEQHATKTPRQLHHTSSGAACFRTSSAASSAPLAMWTCTVKCLS